MSLKNFFTNSSIEKGLVEKHDRQNKFMLRKVLEKDGFHAFILENVFKKEKIIIKRFMFDRFRGTISTLKYDLSNSTSSKNINEIEIRYKTKIVYLVKVKDGNIVIHDNTCNQTLSLDINAIDSLIQLLFSEDLHHPNEVLDRIVTYHKLFQFSFEAGSESITSDLSIKKNLLSSNERYIPSLTRSGSAVDTDFSPELNTEFDKNLSPRASGNQDSSSFQSRLAQRSGDKSYKVDFEQIFAGGNQSLKKALSENSDKSKNDLKSSYFQIPLLSSDVKHFRNLPFKCEFSVRDIEFFRESFLKQRSQELFIGLEIIEAIYKTDGGRLSCFKFPLYYMKVKIQESGRSIILNPVEEGKVFLNHIALANLIERFSRTKTNNSGLDEFFENLLAQSIETSTGTSRIYLTRTLPFDEDIYQKTREILLGYPGENGMGGLLGKLNLVGIECDLESVLLYKTDKQASPVAAALESDLDQIVDLATHKSNKFNQSLLGQFLNPGVVNHAQSKDLFCQTAWIPGALPKSTKRLIDKLNSHDLLLLEGPPGTGKTFTILNLFIHCLCTNKRLLIVSDQKGAIHALTEKIQEYLLGKDRVSAESKSMDSLWKAAIKVVDEIPSTDTKFAKWIQELVEMLGVEHGSDLGYIPSDSKYESQLAAIDKEIRASHRAIQSHVSIHLGQNSDPKKVVASKSMHATTVKDIEELVSFVKFIEDDREINNKGTKYSNKSLIRRFLSHREEILDRGISEIYDFFRIGEHVESRHIERMLFTEAYLHTLIKSLPKTQKSFASIQHKMEQNELSHYIGKKWSKHFPVNANFFKKVFFFVKSVFSHPMKLEFSRLFSYVENQKLLLTQLMNANTNVTGKLKKIHNVIKDPLTEKTPVELEIARYTTVIRAEYEKSNRYSVQEYLERLDVLYRKRDKLIKKQFIKNIGNIANSVSEKDPKDNTSLITSIASILDSLKNQENFESGTAFINDLKEKLVDAFPVWICRKQAVPFLFPCVEKSFDLVIVDEATQCGVDDALPLLYRAKKLIVVGDEKQTVLAKNSVMDDYLFHEFNLEEHLRTTQARGFKGGGSQIFSLVKGIKQAHVLLDEHYRCPPEIIQYSNHYVYHDELKTMQWIPEGKSRSVVIDFSEQKAKDTGKQLSGQFKGIETGMIDRFMEYVAKTIKKIEAEEGKRINVETDVAICYFLLKNEPYVKKIKGDFLTKLNRGNDILDGAGAALQGKERDYMFYLWDINRGNMMSFRQGDDPDKRKGELNVLMSRPKIRAYHYLHKNFDQLTHSSASITDFLWKAYHAQNQKTSKSTFIPRNQKPDNNFIPWRRSSGQMMFEIFKASLGKQGIDASKLSKQFSVTVGDEKHNIDLLVSDRTQVDFSSLGIVDLSGFEKQEISAEEIVDYYFQIKRATPKIQPVFLFVHELSCPGSRAYKRLHRVLEKTASEKIINKKVS